MLLSTGKNVGKGVVFFFFLVTFKKKIKLL